MLNPTLNIVAVPGLRFPFRSSFSRSSSGLYVNKLGILQSSSSDLRDNYDPTTGAYKGWLLESSRTNLLLYSQAIDTPNWTLARVVCTVNAATAPDNTTTACLVTDANDGTSGKHNPRQNVTTDITLPHTASIWMKRPASNATQYAFIYMYDAANPLVNSTVSVFDLVNETVISTNSIGATVSSNAEIQKYPNGWYRLITSVSTYAASGTLARTDFGFTTSTDPNFIGTGVECMYMWGAQLERASSASSYIATTSTATTRSNDNVPIDDVDWFNTREGTFYTRVIYNELSEGLCTFSISDGTDNNRIMLRQAGSPHTQRLTSVVSSVVSPDLTISGTLATGTEYRIAASYANNDFAGCVNGGTVYTTASGAIPSGLNSASLSLPSNHNLLQFAYFPERLTNAELQRLTA